MDTELNTREFTEMTHWSSGKNRRGRSNYITLSTDMLVQPTFDSVGDLGLYADSKLNCSILGKANKILAFVANNFVLFLGDVQKFNTTAVRIWFYTVLLSVL